MCFSKMVTRYERGRGFEYRTANHYKSLGWFVMRSAGSHTAVDLIAIKGKEMKLIQCKRDGRISESEKEEMRKLALPIGAEAILARIDICRKLVLERL